MIPFANSLNTCKICGTQIENCSASFLDKDFTIINSRAKTPDVENHLGVSATCDPSPTRGRHAPQRDATRCNAGQGLVGGRLLVGLGNGARGDPGVPSVTEPEQASRSRAHRLAQPANSYQRQKCSPSRETLPRTYLSRQALP